jgi:hypothetical protein
MSSDKRGKKNRFSSEYTMLSILEYLYLNAQKIAVSKYNIATNTSSIKQQRPDRVNIMMDSLENNGFDQLLFFSPVFVFYLPDDAVTGFILSNITAVLMGIVVGMNVYVFRHSKGLKITAASFFSGSTLSALSSTCASCSSLGFLLVYTFGGLGVTASTFLSDYQIPLRIISVALLIWALYSISNKLTAGCRMKSNV